MEGKRKKNVDGTRTRGALVIPIGNGIHGRDPMVGQTATSVVVEITARIATGCYPIADDLGIENSGTMIGIENSGTMIGIENSATVIGIEDVSAIDPVVHGIANEGGIVKGETKKKTGRGIINGHARSGVIRTMHPCHGPVGELRHVYYLGKALRSGARSTGGAPVEEGDAMEMTATATARGIDLHLEWLIC